MARALIGHTGFVGGNLKAQGSYTHFYRSTDVDAIRGQRFELVVSAGAPAAKWIANKDPAADRAALARLTSALAEVVAERFVLISTVDVYPRPIEVDERTQPARADAQPYGLHRLELEDWVRAHFPNALIVRLPALFGPGLKKNVVFDFLHGNRLDLVHQDGVFQFYGLAHLTDDLERAHTGGVELLNLATEPVTTQDVARVVLGRTFENHLPPPGPRYDFRTRHAALWGREDGYAYGREQVLDDLARFARAERERLARGSGA